MGGANCICSDKTGTLTKNKMNLVQVWNRKIIEIPQKNVDGQSLDMKSLCGIGSDLCKDLIINSLVCNSSAYFEWKESPAKENDIDPETGQIVKPTFFFNS